jgi:hypothetical protein
MRAIIDKSMRDHVWRRAEHRCEYCRIGQEHEVATLCIDHVIARKHNGKTESFNLALSCFSCNIGKGSDLASIDDITGNLVRLFHPRCDEWTAHFAWNGAFLMGLTDVGRVTVRLLNMNASDRVQLRQSLIAEGVEL